jgi:hypothetical protein
VKQFLIAIAGAVLGGILGFYAFFWVAEHGYYGMVLPGGLLGIGAAFGRTKSIWVPVGCATAALALGLFTEWRFQLMGREIPLGDFVRHVFDLNSVHLLMIALGGALGFWMPFRRTEEPK